MAMIPDPGRTPKHQIAPGAVSIAALAAVLALTLAAPSRAATVTGTLVNSSGSPRPGQQIHFENQISRDLFLIETGSGGNFSIDLPPGTYNLRTERGGVIATGIAVDQANIALGTVKEPGPLSWLWFFRRQGVIRGLVKTPAPATANIPPVEEAGEHRGSATGHSSPPAAQASPPAQASTQTSAASGK